MEHVHTMSYESVDHIPPIGIHTQVCKGGSFVRAYRCYRFNGKVYKTRTKLLEAITAHEESEKTLEEQYKAKLKKRRKSKSRKHG